GNTLTFDSTSATDNSVTTMIIIVGTVTNTGCSNTLSTTRTWKAIDACGNSAQCSQTVIVADLIAPTITCAGNKTVEQGAPWTFDPPVAVDTCSAATVSIISTVTNVVGHCGSTFDATRTWQAIDACGNSSSCSQKVTVVDTTAPVITCSSTNKTVEQGTAWTFDPPTATDNSGSATITIL